MELQNEKNVKKEDLEKLIREEVLHYFSIKKITFSNIDIEIDTISVRLYLTPSDENLISETAANVSLDNNIVINNITRATFNSLTFDYSYVDNNKIIVLFRHCYNIIPQ